MRRLVFSLATLVVAGVALAQSSLNTTPGKLSVSKIDTSGTPTASTVLAGDASWASVAAYNYGTTRPLSGTTNCTTAGDLYRWTTPAPDVLYLCNTAGTGSPPNGSVWSPLATAERQIVDSYATDTLAISALDVVALDAEDHGLQPSVSIMCGSSDCSIFQVVGIALTAVTAGATERSVQVVSKGIVTGINTHSVAAGKPVCVSQATSGALGACGDTTSNAYIGEVIVTGASGVVFVNIGGESASSKSWRIPHQDDYFWMHEELTGGNWPSDTWGGLTDAGGWSVGNYTASGVYPGIPSMHSGAATEGGMWRSVGTGTGIFSLSGGDRFAGRYSVSALATSVVDYNVLVGYCDDTGSALVDLACTDGVYFSYDRDTSVYWRYCTEQADTINCVATAISPTVAPTFQTLEIVINDAGTGADFFIDGVRQNGSIITTIPSPTQYVNGGYTGIAKDTGTASTAAALYVDYLELSKTGPRP